MSVNRRVTVLVGASIMHFPLLRSAQAGGTLCPTASAELGERIDAHVLETAVDGQGHDHRVRPEALGETMRADHVRPRRDAREDALFAREPKRHLDRLVVFDRL